MPNSSYQKRQTQKLNPPSVRSQIPTIPTVLFVSNSLERCGVAQYGCFVFEAIAKSEQFSLYSGTCANIDDFQRLLPEIQPDIIIYNYHPDTLPWVNARVTRSIPHVAHVALMHECDDDKSQTYDQSVFDYFIFQDPTMPLCKPYFFKTGRLLPTYHNTKPMPEIFTVGTIGFGFACKGVEVLVSTVQHQCDRAKIELHLPFNEYADPEGQNTSLVLAERCRKIVHKPGIELNINHQFLSKADLLDRMASCSINAFLYSNLRKGGISSVIDLALAVRRPIAISRCEMFRHISDATPSIFAEERSLVDIHADGLIALEPYYERWKEINFIETYNTILTEILHLHSSQKTSTATFFTRTTEHQHDAQRALADTHVRHDASSDQRIIPTITGDLAGNQLDRRDLSVFINACVLSSELHKQGMRLYHFISKIKTQQFQYHECQTADQLSSLIHSFKNIHGMIPRNIIYHYDAFAMNWLSSNITALFPDQQHILVHANRTITNLPLDQGIADIHILLTNFNSTSQRFIYADEFFFTPCLPTAPMPTGLSINILGFAIPDQELQSILMNVQRDFEQARVVIFIPDYEALSEDMPVAISTFLNRLRKSIWKPGISIHFESSPQTLVNIVEVLSASSLNIVGNHNSTVKGQHYLSSVLRIAFTLLRPLALSEQVLLDPDIRMSPSLSFNGSNIKSIIDYDTAQREDLHRLMYYALAKGTVESVIQEPTPFRFHKVFSGSIQSIGVSGVACLNGVLDDSARHLYSPIVDVMLNKIPQEMERKIPRANVQQAFVVDTVAKLSSLFDKPKILCVGSYEDTAALTLHVLQYPLDGLDPVHNFDLRTFCELPTTEPACYDIIFSTSVIEHVEDDEAFIQDIRYLLKPGGFGVLTCDYDDHWKPGLPLPECDWRMYTQYDLAERFMRVLDDCLLVGPVQWDCPHPDFSFGAYTYTFATMVFQRSTYATTVSRPSQSPLTAKA